MTLNLRSERARQRERTIQLRLLAGLERSSALRFAREFNRVGREVARHFKEQGGAVPLLEPILEEHQSRLRALFNQLYAEAGAMFGARIRQAAGKMLAKQEDEEETLFQLAMRQFTDAHSGQRIAEISSTTLSQLRLALDAIDLEGLGEIPGARLIEEATGGQIAQTRGRMIARTEGHTASQFASNTQMTQLGVEFKKRWVSVQDGRTRTIKDDAAFDHRQANGQKVGKTAQFLIKKKAGGTEALDFPGDPKGSAANIINCRCIQVYEVVGG